MSGTELQCGRCGWSGTPELVWRQFENTRKWHLGATCAECGRHIKWVPQAPEWIAAAPPAPDAVRERLAAQPVKAPGTPSEAQIRYLEALGYDGERPATKREASDMISRLVWRD